MKPTESFTWFSHTHTGIVECEVIQWFVEPGALVEEFSPLCEVQSDKASVEITSRFAGTVKKLYYEAGEMAKVGKPFVDIDIQGEPRKEDVEALIAPVPDKETPVPEVPSEASGSRPEGRLEAVEYAELDTQDRRPKGKMAALATPAVRHLSKELKVDIVDIDGTGKDGRVLKEDIYQFVQRRDAGSPSSPPQVGGGPAAQSETQVQLSQTQHMMFKSMTRSLNIPHFLFADEVDFSNLVDLRSRLNRVLAKDAAALSTSSSSPGQPAKLSYLPFIIKAVSLALHQFPILNARVDVAADGDDSGGSSSSSSSKPTLVYRSRHNIGVAMDTPQGLLVPVVKDVGARSILSIAGELARLQGLAQAGRLAPADLAGGTITVSNIGNIGGTYLSPVITAREVAILGIGRMRTVPAFDASDNVVKRQVCNFSWSADHRVVDGATMARAADFGRRLLEEPDVFFMMHLK